MLDASTYRAAFHREAAALAVAACDHLEARVPSCPDWTVAELLTHLTGIYAHRVTLVRLRARENAVLGFDDLDLPREYKGWFDAHFAGQGRPEAMPPGLLELFEQTAATLEEVLWGVDASEPIGTWWPADQTAGFLQRRMAQETAVHRWDAQLARGQAQPIEPELAADGIDEALEVMLPAGKRWATSARAGSGESYHFHRTDGPGEWLVRFDPEGVTVTHEHAHADVAARGPASDLLLFLWHRIPADRLEVFGDAALLNRYFELAPPN